MKTKITAPNKSSLNEKLRIILVQNIIPLIGLLFLNWQAKEIVFIYGLQIIVYLIIYLIKNFVIAIYNHKKIGVAIVSNVSMVVFFCLSWVAYEVFNYFFVVEKINNIFGSLSIFQFFLIILGYEIIILIADTYNKKYFNISPDKYLINFLEKLIIFVVTVGICSPIYYFTGNTMLLGIGYIILKTAIDYTVEIKNPNWFYKIKRFG